jgi:Cyclic-phosphate processing Receiver domain
MSYNLFFDDFRDPGDCFEYMRHPVYIDAGWITVRCYDEFVKHVQENGMPEMISFDHDIYHDDEDKPEKTGYDCARWLINYCIDNKKELPARIFIHSQNPAGSRNIESLFVSYLKSLDLPSPTGTAA